MSIEKTVSYEEIPYTQVYTHVIQNINNPIAGFIWIYLLSKPKDWAVIKEHLKNKFKLGDDKLKKIFSYLKSRNLIEYIVHKNNSGQVIKFETRILNGSKFITDQKLNELSTEVESTGVEIHPVENHTCGNGALHIKEDTNKRDKQKIESNVLPLWLSKDIWEEFKQHRKEMKKPLTLLAEKKALSILEDLREEGHNPIEVITISIVNAWTGLFPIKKQTIQNNFTKEQPQRPRMKDFTQERLDREAKQAH